MFGLLLLPLALFFYLCEAFLQLLTWMLTALGEAIWGRPAPRPSQRRTLARQDPLHCASCGRSTTPLERLYSGSLPECRSCRRNRLTVLRSVTRR